MKFFHVYNEECFKGLEKNGLINEDTGFKIQHVFSIPEDKKFNRLAAKGTKLHSMIKEGRIPFYVDRIAGGVTYHKYDFDKALIREYIDILGNDFLGFQLHESASNRRNSDWQSILRRMNGEKGPYDAKKLREASMRSYAKMPDGTVLPGFSQDTPEFYATLRYAETPAEYLAEMEDMFSRRMSEVEGRILPCDSYYLATKMQDKLGMHTFMPEVGCQIPLMREEVALARGNARVSKKSWGTYYECWRASVKDGKSFFSMPCFNTDPSNEWYLTQELHPDDFTSYGKNGGSSRLLQNRIYHYALMAGADYFSEEWGLNCSYSDMTDFTLSEYGELKKSFISFARSMKGIKATVPFAIVLPNKYACVELQESPTPSAIGKHRGQYLRCVLNAEAKEFYGHIEDVLKLIFNQTEPVGNEGHVITNSPFPDVFDIIYEDASDEALSKYEYLIDATSNGSFAKAKAVTAHKVLESCDLERLAFDLDRLIKEVMPCYVDGLCWLVSTDSQGNRYLSIFNNEGNERSLEVGDIIHREADKKVKVSFKDAAVPTVIRESAPTGGLEKLCINTYGLTIPAAGFVILKF